MSSTSDQRIEALKKYIELLEQQRDQYKEEAAAATKALIALRETVTRAIGRDKS